MDSLTGTKELIFDTFVEMTSALGYENVHIRDIAAQIGINSASIYYHYENKAKILEFAYDYYKLHEYDNRRPVEVMQARLMEESGDTLVPDLFFTFESEDLQKYTRMVLITKIIFMRLYQDEAANAIYYNDNVSNTEYLLEILQYGIDAGRLDPGFDILTFSEVLIGAMQIMGTWAFARPAYIVGQLDQEKKILALLGRLYNTALL